MKSQKPSEDAPVSLEEWVIDDLLLSDPSRVDRLLHGPSPTDLITSVAEAAMRAAVPGGLVQCRDEPEYVRLEARVPVPSKLFDSLLNGRTGYRALGAAARHDHSS
jgi:hypothetical protein